MKAGRPSEYTPEHLEAARQYLLQCDRTGDLPQIAGLAIALQVSRKTLYNWADQNDDFLHIFELILSEQEKTLVKYGLEGKFNSTITKLMLTKHGYHDKQETDITSGGDKLTVQPIMYATQDTPPLQSEATPAQSTESTG